MVTFNQDKVILVCWAASYKHTNIIMGLCLGLSEFCFSGVPTRDYATFFSVKMEQGSGHYPHLLLFEGATNLIPFQFKS